MIEVEVHQQLRAFLRESGEDSWHHQLTMARLVARALRIGRSALIQTGLWGQGRYRLSYLMPLLMWDVAVILVAPQEVQDQLLHSEIPRLQQWMGTFKPVVTGDRIPNESFTGLLLISPQAWLQQQLTGEGFPPGIPTIIDGVDDLETWTRQVLTHTLTPRDWEALMRACPQQIDLIRDVRVKLTKVVFAHPPNPYECYLLEDAEWEFLRQFFQVLAANRFFLPPAWQSFARQLNQEELLAWTEVNRSQGQFTLACAPIEVASVLERVWERQPVVLIGGSVDLETQAPIFRAAVGLPEVTSLKFSLDLKSELVNVYLPDPLPLPNTALFQQAFLQEVRALLGMKQGTPGLTVLIVGDMPLRSQVGSILAAEYGTRVQVDKITGDEQSILVTGWEFWRQHQRHLPAPTLLVIATLPIPSLEHPLVAGRVAYYKRRRLDWFRLYLLPQALTELQRAIAPLRDRQGIVALFDSRILHRSYGQAFLTALSPLARINYLDSSWFYPINYSILD